MYIIKEATYNDDIDIMNKFFKVSKELWKNNRILAFNAHDKSLIWPEYELFTKKKNIPRTGKPHQCYNNSFINSKENGLKLAGGFFINKDLIKETLIECEEADYKFSHMIGAFCGPHAWNIDDKGNVIDITLKSSNYIYIGEVLDVNKFNDWKDVEKEIVSKYNNGKQSKDWGKINVYN